MGYRLILIAVLLSACGQLPPLEPGSDPRPPGDGEQCATTCEHYRELDCIEGEPSPKKGIPCEERCRVGEEFEAEPHDCIQAADSCEAARACEEDRANNEEP